MGGYSTDKSGHDPDPRIAINCTSYFFLDFEASLLVPAFRFLPVIGSILASNSDIAFTASSVTFVRKSSYEVVPFPGIFIELENNNDIIIKFQMLEAICKF